MNLQKCDIFEQKTLKEPMDFLTLANNPETMEKIEGCMKVWIKQTEQVIFRNQTPEMFSSLNIDQFTCHVTEPASGRRLSHIPVPSA